MKKYRIIIFVSIAIIVISLILAKVYILLNNPILREEAKIFKRDGHLWRVKTYKDGIITRDKYYDEKGKIVSEYPYIKGVIHGVVKGYFKDGTIAWVLEYKYGKKDGRIAQFYSDGTLFYEAYYRYAGILPEGYVYPDGVLHGRATTYLRDAKVFATGIYINGLPWDGMFISSTKDRVEIIIDIEDRYLISYKDGKRLSAEVISEEDLSKWKFPKVLVLPGH